ncbi:hypothetical protein DXG01_008827 [Tephrocybe rancida]|nr:hypothetical protein DXG01_008827 [Tephrocybe rancida]
MTIIFETEEDREWAVDQILSHAGAKKQATFEVLWKSGDRTWLPYAHVLEEYLEAHGVDKITNLKIGSGTPPDDKPQTFSGSIMIEGLNFDPISGPTMADTQTNAASNVQHGPAALPPVGEAPPLPADSTTQGHAMENIEPGVMAQPGTGAHAAPVIHQPVPALPRFMRNQAQVVGCAADFSYT